MIRTGSVILFVLLRVVVTLGVFAAVCFAQVVHQPNASQEESLVTLLKNYLRNPAVEDDETTRYVAALVDLEDNGTQDAVVYLSGRSWCGSGGCMLLVLEPKGSSWKVNSKATVTRPPIRVLATKSNGWHDLSVQVQGGGIPRAHEAKLAFNGKKYPSNPSVSPALPVKQKVIGQVVVPLEGEGKSLY